MGATAETNSAGRATWCREMGVIGLLVAVLLAVMPGTSSAERRVALVIGNAAYEERAAELVGAVDDARSVAWAFRELDFDDVFLREDLDREGMERAADEFVGTLRSGDVAVFYYAGHGTELDDGLNYLLPVDFSSSYDPVQARNRSLRADEVQARMEAAGAQVRIVILDACRDNPFDPLGRFMGRRGGLNQMPARGGLVAFATEAGDTAADSGLYARHLVEALGVPGLQAMELFTRVSEAVARASGGDQVPIQQFGGTVGRFVFHREDTDIRTLTFGIPASATLSRGDRDRWTFTGRAGDQVTVELRSEDFDTYLELHGPAGEPVAEDDDDGGGLDSLIENQTLAESGEYTVVARAYYADGGGRYSLSLRRGVDPVVQERLFWESILGSQDPDDFEEFLAVFPRGRFAGLARDRLEDLRHWPVGEVRRDCTECPEMVVVPAGSYMMGSPTSEEGRAGDEGPRHRVTISSPFAVGVYEVTFAEWDACVSAGGCGGHRPSASRWGRGSRPVMNVSWEDVQAYVRWLSGRTGKSYRLLSESEWEYVARGDTQTSYWWGDSVGRDRANCRSCGSQWDRRETAPVGSFVANRFGLHDVSGNVWEWVEDCWHDDYRGAPADGSAWTSGENCRRRVLRGGSWFTEPRALRSAHRGLSAVGTQNRSFGFRVAMTLD